MSGLVPAVLMMTAAASAGAQTRTAPSIGDAVRRAPTRVITQPGVSARGLPLPGGQGCRDSNGYGYDGRFGRNYRNDNDRHLSDRERAERARQERIREEQRRYGSAGCCVDDGYRYGNGRDGRGTVGRTGTGTGTINSGRYSGTGTMGKTGVTGNGRVNPHANAQNGCGHDDHDRRNDRRYDNRQDQWRHDQDRDRRDPRYRR
jgi:hypothetical protein